MATAPAPSEASEDVAAALEKGFEHLAGEIAKDVANEILKVFKRT